MSEWNTWLNNVKTFYKKYTVSKIINLSSLLFRKINDNRPYINIKINNKYITALIDTGSNISVLGKYGIDFLKNFPIVINDALVKVTTADGQPQDILGCTELDVNIQSVSKKINFYLIPAVTHDVILGIDFLKQFNVNIDFSSFSFDVTSLSVINTIQDVSKLNSDERVKLDKVIDKFKSIGPNDKIGKTKVLSHYIDTGNSPPFKQPQYPLPQAMQEHVNKEIDELLRLGIIQKSNSSYCSPLWLVKKPNGTYRVCFDGRKLNSITVNKSAYPLPLIDTIITKLRDARYITSIDLKQAFFQIPLEESSREKTAFAVRGKGLFEFVTMPFGLVSAPQTMCRLMDLVIGPSLEPNCFYYLDDLIICTPTFEKHLEVLEQVFEKLRDANLTVNLGKCCFCRSSLKYLGYVVDEYGLRTDPDKVSSICNFPVPKTTTQVRRLIGMIGYYRRFLKDFSKLASPITDLLHNRKKGQSIVWTPQANEAFEKIKVALTTAPILSSPDFSKKFYLMADASNFGVGCVLFQTEDGGLEHPIAYASKKLNKCQKLYTTTEKELLAVLFGIEHFRYYLEGRQFTVITDHSSLVWLHNMKNPSPRLARWILKLSQYDFNIVHRKASGTVIADALSRIHDVNLLDLSLLQLDDWYKKMIQDVKANPDKFPTFKVENNILYKHIFDKFAPISNGSNWKIVVPTKNREEILAQFHDHPTASHFGLYKTLARISEIYYWPNMRKSVYKYIKKCRICASCKPSNLPQAGLMGAYRNINFPFQLISCDLLGPYVRSRKGNQYLLVIVDWFTKFPLVHALPKATAPAIAKFIENNVFLIFGVPQIISVDNGKQFTCKIFKDLMEKYNVQKIWYNANYHPQINHTERVNKSIVTAIRSFAHENHRTWDEEVYKIAQAIRLSKHEVTEQSPSFLTFARNVPISGDFYGKISESANNIITISDKVHRLQDIQSMPPIFDRVRKRLYDSYLKSKERYNFRKRDLGFHVGDYVWKKNYMKSDKANFITAKLCPKYVPCIITKVVSPLVYELKDRDGNFLGRWHQKDLKADATMSDSDDDSSVISQN